LPHRHQLKKELRIPETFQPLLTNHKSPITIHEHRVSSIELKWEALIVYSPCEHTPTHPEHENQHNKGEF
jgi:hypothetical protein